jgi:CBS domain-containing protein
MKVSELMNPRVVTVGPETPLHKVMQLMLQRHLNDIVVVDSEQRLAGIVTYSDLSRKLLPTQKDLMEHEEYLRTPALMADRFRDITGVAVEEIMTRDVLTVTPEVDALKAGATMTARRVKQLPVVQDEKVIGIISHTDIGWGLMMRYAEDMRG